ncbi:amidase signature enzyme [Lactarius indigo]|nr:amidase signature enzyme [Lactarius indigo]
MQVLWTVFVFLTFQLLLCGGSSGITVTPRHARLPDLYEASIAELQHGLDNGHFTSVDLVKVPPPVQCPFLTTLPPAQVTVHLRSSAPSHHAMRPSSPNFAQLALYCWERPISLKWANFRGIVPSGFSGRGGQSTCPYFPLANPSGSSSGSGIASAIGLATAALGTETEGSIIFPSSRQNLVGIKPTVGLTSRAGVIPISENQDTVGPMARSVADAAVILTAIAGRDPLDNFTLAAPARVPDFSKALRKGALQGVRLGVPRLFLSGDPNIDRAFNASLVTLAKLGATIVDPAEPPDANELLVSNNETIVLNTDFKVDVEEYISRLIKVPTGVKTLADLIAFNIAHASQELVPPFWTDQSQFIASENTTRDAAYFAALAADHDLGRTRGIDATLAEFKLDAIVLPTDVFASVPAAVAGYPVVTVPLGFQPDTVVATPARPTINMAPGLPFGLSFVGTAFSEFKLVGYAFAYEQATHTRLKRLAFPEAIPKTQLADVMEK